MLKEKKKFLENLLNQLERTRGKFPFVVRKGKSSMTHPARAALTFLCWMREMSPGIFSSGSKSENTSKISHTMCDSHKLAKKFLPCVQAEVRTAR